MHLSNWVPFIFQPRKTKFFRKENSTKFLLIHGNTEAVNADGEKLENILVPVSKNYKPVNIFRFLLFDVAL